MKVLALLGRPDSQSMVWIMESEQQLNLANQMTETFKQNQAFVENRFANGLATSLTETCRTSCIRRFSSEQNHETSPTECTGIRDLELVLGEYPRGRWI